MFPSVYYKLYDRKLGPRNPGTQLTAVADPEGVPRVPWNPSFEGLPSKMLCANVRIRRAHGLHVALTVETMSEESERIKAYSCVAPPAARDGDMISV